MRRRVFLSILLSVGGFAAVAQAAVVAEYAVVGAGNHELSRAEQRCMDEGYKVTFANCSKMTAPTDRCPHHPLYYKSCSQEQWCRNNNYTFAAEDCELPAFPQRKCDNQHALYRACHEDIAKACTAAGYSSKENCQLSEKKCPYSDDWGECCGSCAGFDYLLNAVPEGYVAVGDICTTCTGEVKTKITPAACEGFMACEYGPLSDITPSCLQGKTRLFSACKTSADICQEKGYNSNSCAETENASDCPENQAFKRCTINCLKWARHNQPQADIIDVDTVDPMLDLSKVEMHSLVGMTEAECQDTSIPLITLHINSNSMALYEHVFDRKIDNMNFNVVFEEAIPLSANGSFHNVKINVSGNLPDCPLKAQSAETSGVVSFNGIPTLCIANLNVNDNSKFISSGSVRGNVKLGKNASLALRKDLIGSLNAGMYSEIYIKGSLICKDDNNTSEESESIVFGCNSKAKIEGGVVADTSVVVLKQDASVDTPNVRLISVSDNPQLYNSLASIRLHMSARLYASYGESIYPLVENQEVGCSEKYFTYLGSASETAKQALVLEPSNRLEGQWQCRSLLRRQQQCD